MTFNEFTEKLCKKRGPKGNFKIRGSWGVYDAYKHIRKNKWYNIGRAVKEHEFYSVIREVNDLLVEEFLKGNPILFPARMGRLELRKKQKGVSIVDGKIKIHYPVKWAETIKLWYEDAEAMKNKILLRDEEGDIFRIKYNKYEATYENKQFYEFAVNRFLKRKLKDLIKQGKINSLW